MMNKKIWIYVDAFQFEDPTPLNSTGSSGSGNNLTPENNKVFYNTNMIRLVGPALVHDQFAKKEPIPKKHGKTIEFRGFEPLAKATTPLTEGVTPQGSKLDMFTVTATLKQYGDYVALTDVLDMTAIDNIVLEAQEGLGDQAGRTLDTITREVINAGTNVRYANGKASRTALTESDTLTVKAVKLAVKDLKRQNAPRIKGKYCAIVHPDIWFDLTEDPDYKEIFKYTENSAFKNGFLASFEGVEWYESTEAKIFAKGGASNADVYSTIVTGKDAYATTPLAGEGMETIIHPRGSAGTADALNQRSTVGWKSMKAVSILTQQYMVRIESGCSTNLNEGN